MAPNLVVPSPLKSKTTYQPDALCVLITADALLTCLPKTSAGANINLLTPPRSQLITVADSLPLLPPWRFSGLVQSRAAN